MSFWMIFKVAVFAILRNKARAVLTCLGIIVGIVVAANVIGKINNWPIIIEVSSVVCSFLFSAFVGMFFGFYPAYRASKLNPIDCLRYE